jgi:type II secretory ATPase GspE/PulE/Tfp pilus assembly ATPase PilB-like protein
MPENEFMDLVSDLRGQLEEQIRLDEISKKVLSTLDLDEILREITEGAIELLACERATVFVIQEGEGGGPRYLVSRKMTGGSVKEIRVPVSPASLAGYVASTGTPIRIQDVYDEAELRAVSDRLRFDQSWDRKTGFRTKSVVVAPAKAKETIVGVIQALNKTTGEGFTDRDVEILTKFAEGVGIALQNSQSHTRVLRRARRVNVSELLVEKGIIDAEQLKQAQARAKEARKKLLDVLVEQFNVSEVEITKCLAELNDCEYLPFNRETIINRDLFENVPESYCKRHLVCPYKQTMDTNGNLQLAIVMHNPKDFVAIEDIEIRTHAKVTKIYMSTRNEILMMIKSALHPEELEEVPESEEAIGELFNALAEDLGIESDDEVEAANISEGAKEDDAPIVRLCNRIIEDSYRMGASDIHIEPAEKLVLIRARRDGSLEKILNIPAHARNALVARYKIMSDLNITEHRVPQDGRIRFKEHGGRYNIELRVNVLPTVGGNEDIVMRILADSKPLPLEKMGFLPHVIEPYRQQFLKPYGMILCVGPTGSGKTTTLHATVAEINTPDKKILTAENPVEITQDGLRQVQIRPEVGLTFKEALRAFLRQDPDVIMVGEMRDFETCSIAVEAALTGHLLFSTLHTNSAPETVTRLVDIGIDPVTLSDALLCVLAQRLTKTLCSKCREKAQLPQEELDLIGASVKDGQYHYLGQSFPVEESYIKGEGCDACNGSGHKGRMGIHELLVCNDEVKRMLVSGARIHEIREAAKKPDDHGWRMFELFEDGFIKVLMGRTSAQQIRAVCVE